MFRQLFVIAIAAAAATLLAPGEAKAWGARHVGYTHVGPAGVSHYGATAARGPYGSYGGAHAGAYGYGGASYHAGYGGAVGGASGGAYHYNTGSGSAYHYGTVPSVGYGSAGVYRRW